MRTRIWRALRVLGAAVSTVFLAETKLDSKAGVGTCTDLSFPFACGAAKKLWQKTTPSSLVDLAATAWNLTLGRRKAPCQSVSWSTAANHGPRRRS